jgi:hypothetical protein
MTGQPGGVPRDARKPRRRIVRFVLQLVAVLVVCGFYVVVVTRGRIVDWIGR